jgi:hypothetical protein
MTDAEPVPTPDAKKAIAMARAECVARIGSFYVERTRLSAALAELDAKIAGHEADVLAMDKVASLFP